MIADQTKLNLLINATDMGDYELVVWLYNQGVNIDEIDENGQTPLMMACMTDNEEIAEFLLKEGANTDIKDVNGKTAYDLAEEDTKSLLTNPITK